MVKKVFVLMMGVITIMICTASVAYAAFADKGKISGSSFSVGNSDIKILLDISKGIDTTNLADEITGPAFTNIGPNWKKDYLIKIYNNGSTELQIATHAKYSTANDLGELRQAIYVEPIMWNDSNQNGEAEATEQGESLGKKTIVKWSTEGFDLGQIGINQTKGYILRFSTESLSDTKQGKTAIFDFEFDSVNQ